ncbi:Sensor histidine kinase [Pseudomonas syringae pv. delphinii]|uniref:histidine kinase n=2 Tax=Pseudomonas syringae group TaxID=136849 RepID=A0A0P9QA65_9PSED|nr:sensor histidine kinase [Pseudomonas syringae group genomosp. 3]KPX27613.1 Sensor histidine kinase [Pseudomonas syringae pv. delphinii]POD75351.1 two-component sensor histidine kinase [Pseudomonas syringae group genomosp. 3]RMP09801.1 Sensor histidine kinase [Pseudomonas syringae pv. delphinii]RMP16808.1 Sensor histidine kinase [Pseudomonas syringae pv. delphinii]RMQ17636.1 Sensor histidine kinase [Pseudomonas syringae pv. delphinii]
MTSVRARILVPVLLLLLLGNLAISLLALRDSHHEIEEVYDAQLAQSARLLQGVLSQRAAGEQDLDKLYQAFDQAMSRVGTSGVAHPYETRLTFQVWRTSGELLVRSAEAPLLSAPPAAEGSHDLIENGHEWCGFLLADPQQGFLIWVGERDDVRQDLIQRIVSHTVWPTLIGVPLLVVAIWLAIGWGLRPLQSMAEVIRKRDAESLEPLDVAPLPKELEPMQHALNRLLTQIESVLERERRFIADAAHELRTPLTILRIHAQNARQAESPEQRLEALDFLVHGVDRAARLASQLLTMARLEPRLEVSQLQTFELNTLVREEMAELTPLALEKRVDLVFEAGDDCVIHSDPSAITIALQNLLTNALNFAPPASEIRVMLNRQEDGSAHLSVEDAGPGIDEKQKARLFERFYSQGHSNGAGLGLAIVDMIVRKLESSLHLRNSAQGGLCAELRLKSRTA